MSQNECWLYAGQINIYGYGIVKAGLNQHMVHRVMYENEVGAIPDGLFLDHLCRVRCCINPRHLEPVTARENLLRGDTIAARNAKKTHCYAGHEFNKRNTYMGSSGKRRCRTCHAVTNVRYRKRIAMAKVAQLHNEMEGLL